MAFQTPVTIHKALTSIQTGKYVLPAIQREFVWRPGQIARLFDSLMRGYPIGSFLFWKVSHESIREYRFYDFMLNFHQKNNPHCSPLGHITQDEITAVLDGQQRLTALNIGLRGSYAYKLPHKWWRSPDAFPRRHLYLNILDDAEENDAGMRHDFRFLREEDARKRDEKRYWYRVGKILGAEDAADLYEFLLDKELTGERRPFRVLNKLHAVVHKEPVVAYYEEENQDLDKVLDIFIRTNSGGTTLSYSDMLMSMATAQWEMDAREAIHGTVDEINAIGEGFGFSHDFLLKAGLMLAGIKSVRFKVTNFNQTNMKQLEKQWDDITRAIRVTVELVSGFGFSRGSLSAHNAVLPIAHYLHRRGTPTGFLASVAHREDRNAIQNWLTRSLLKRGIWGSGLDSLLTALRDAIDLHGEGAFPAARLEEAMRKRGKGLKFEEEELQDLVESNDRTFALLSLLYPLHNFRTDRFDIDHVFPKSRFTSAQLRKAHVPEHDIPAFRDRANRLPNLQLLDPETNRRKSDRPPHAWLSEDFDAPAADEHMRRQDLGDVPADRRDFPAFYEARRDQLLGKLRQLL
ncbi:MAG: DUF262 domain-containing protein [Gammaproteobacteria bacterium]|nr:DUF262 domain-containing protein [Gammaproteobacteria bacterium]